MLSSIRKMYCDKQARVSLGYVKDTPSGSFKNITTDNGSEFASLSELEKLAETLVYFAHPYTSCEKGTVERHNGLIRRFIPKGKRIDSYLFMLI